jgi:cell pole-organizing protein PopZ
MHVPHVSHSGHLGFLEQPLAAIADQHDSQAHINFVPADNNKSAAAVSTCDVAEAVKSVKERATETSAQPLTNTTVNSALFQSLTEDEASSNAPPTSNFNSLQQM